jgi:DNA-binding winged helix-turn-helix (wHTH) protein
MRVRFGDCVLDSETRQLFVGKEEVHLQPKAFQFLELLIQNRPKALSKNEIHEKLWPGTFVSDGTLTSLLAEVRDAVGDRARESRFVRTVHRFGYAFGGVATELESRVPPTDGDRVRCWIIWEFGQIALRDGEHLLGRDGDVAIWLESPTVSRHHARIRVSGAEATIEDLGSKNGTHLRGACLTAPASLTDGDEILLGSVMVKFRRPGTGASTDTF